jgi:hypothetical protein
MNSSEKVKTQNDVDAFKNSRRHTYWQNSNLNDNLQKGGDEEIKKRTFQRYKF